MSGLGRAEELVALLLPVLGDENRTGALDSKLPLVNRDLEVVLLNELAAHVIAAPGHLLAELEALLELLHLDLVDVVAVGSQVIDVGQDDASDGDHVSDGRGQEEDTRIEARSSVA